MRKPPKIRTTTWAAVFFFLTVALFIGAAIWCFANGYTWLGIFAGVMALMVRTAAINDGPNDDGHAIFLHIFHMEYVGDPERAADKWKKRLASRKTWEDVKKTWEDVKKGE